MKIAVDGAQEKPDSDYDGMEDSRIIDIGDDKRGDAKSRKTKIGRAHV